VIVVAPNGGSSRGLPSPSLAARETSRSFLADALRDAYSRQFLDALGHRFLLAWACSWASLEAGHRNCERRISRSDRDKKCCQHPCRQSEQRLFVLGTPLLLWPSGTALPRARLWHGRYLPCGGRERGESFSPFSSSGFT